MDPFLNPYAPGAGAPPPELAGRDELLNKAAISLRRIAAGRFWPGLILTGLRGVGKTVLLNQIRRNAEIDKLLTVRMEVAEGRSLPSLLAPGLKTAILRLNRTKAAGEVVLRGLRALANFTSAMKVKYHDVEITLDVEAEPLDVSAGVSLDESLSQLFQSVGNAAKEKKTAVVLFIDELHALEEKQLAALIMAFHVAAQDLLPITMIAAGLPQTLAKMGAAKTYAERLFEFFKTDELERTAAIQALVIPAEKLGIHYLPEALDTILQQTQGYPYFLQEWGKHVWDVAQSSPITKQDVKTATDYAIAELDESFFRVRFDQLTSMQKRYLRAMAELGAGPHFSGKIASVLSKKVTALGNVREQLINDGLIYSPSHGETAFTVPLFDGFMKRILPNLRG